MYYRILNCRGNFLRAREPNDLDYSCSLLSVVAMWLPGQRMTTISKITKTAVDALAASPGQTSILWESGLPGFGVKCTERGTKSYFVKYRLGAGGRAARQRWFTIGRHGVLTPDQARALAREILSAVARGEDPQQEKLGKRRATTVADVWDRFSDERLKQLKPQTRYEYDRQWRKLLAPAFGSQDVSTIGRGDVDGFHKKHRHAPYMANRALALLSKLMNLSEKWEYRPPGSNPCRHTERFREKPRERYLSEDELSRLGSGLERMVQEKTLSSDCAAAIRLLLFTGARLSEILTLEWDWIDIDRKVIALPDSKTGAKPIFLNRLAVAVLKEQSSTSSGQKFVFPGPGAKGHMVNLRKPWQRVCEAIGIEGVRLHDLRHTVASVAVGQGTSLPLIGRLLGHSQAQTTQRYAHVDAIPAIIASEAVADAIGKSMGYRLED